MEACTQEWRWLIWCIKKVSSRVTLLPPSFVLPASSPPDPTSSWCSVSKSCSTLCDPVNCSTPGFPVLHYLPQFIHTHVHWISDAIQPSHPLLPPSLPALNLSQHSIFSKESALPIRWSKYCSFSFSISPSSEYSGLISFRIDWFDLAIQGTLKNLLQPTIESIDSLAFSLLYGPALTSVHDYWKNHSFDYLDLCWWSDISAF